jgi:alkylation response protein AidB-like acyl-CoA dehydrogenase
MTMPAPEAVGDSDEFTALTDLVRQITEGELAPQVDRCEEAGEFPRQIFRTLGKAGLLGLPYPERYGGGGLGYLTYLSVLEELSTVWLAVGMGISVHTLACLPVATFGSEEQRERWLPELLGGELLGGYCLSEAESGSDAAALATTATHLNDAYLVNGTKSWITHGGQADFYTLFARTSEEGPRGVSCFLAPGTAPGLIAGTPERKMGLRSSVTAQLTFSEVQLDAHRLIGAEGNGFQIALTALDSGRLGIAACATGVARAACDAAVAYARERYQFGRAIIDHQGIGFLLADMATQVEAGRALYRAAARLHDSGRPFGAQAAMAKLFCTDMAMKVTTDAIQVLGGTGYVADYPVERYFREAKVLQILEGTNQIQRLVIARHLARS